MEFSIVVSPREPTDKFYVDERLFIKSKQSFCRLFRFPQPNPLTKEVNMKTVQDMIDVFVHMVKLQTESLSVARTILGSVDNPYDNGYCVGRIHEKEQQIEWLERQIEQMRKQISPVESPM